MTNDQPSPKSKNPKQKYDLEERTAEFAERIIDFSKKVPQNQITKPLINQIVRSGTSIGANYSEADEANSKKDFINKIAIAKKETKETKYWLRIIAYTLPELKDDARKIWKEAQELNLILAAIIRNSNNKK
ncbi:four helix bundle protein [Patescibacteria group bacterium]|nr:four helix bundle protein [Patescibacteria group bacterium]MBU4337960.1 four helix bundle protein [Patescibacteria group bacterium]